MVPLKIALKRENVTVASKRLDNVFGVVGAFSLKWFFRSSL